MESFYFFIPLAVISAMGLTTDGQTVSKQVRVSDLFADGTLSAKDYHALSSAGMVVLNWPVFTFHAIDEMAEGWVCTHAEPEYQAWVHTTQFLREMFSGGNAWGKAVKLPYYIEGGGLYVRFNRRHPEAEALARSGWARAVPVDTFEYDDGESYSDPFVED